MKFLVPLTFALVSGLASAQMTQVDYSNFSLFTYLGFGTCDLVVKKEGSVVSYKPGSSASYWFEGPWADRAGKLELTIGHQALGEAGAEHIVDALLTIDFVKAADGSLQPNSYTFQETRKYPNGWTPAPKQCNGLNGLQGIKRTAAAN